MWRCATLGIKNGNRVAICDVTAIVQITEWVYQQIEKANGQVWVMEKVLRQLDPEWAKCFAM